MRVVIIGAGPAGLAAAEAALAAGATVDLLDTAGQPGGQYHRQPAQALAPQHGRRAFDRSRHRVLGHPRCTFRPGAAVWALERRDGEAPLVHVVSGEADGAGRQRDILEPGALVLATGAHDRVLPFPGWDLPGVFTAGAAQALAKGERIAIGDRVVVAGTGPFLLPVAASLLAVGSRVLGVLEANRPGTILRGWAARGWELLPQAGKAAELAGYAARQLRHRVPYRTGRAVVAARGDGRVEEIVTARISPEWTPIPGSEHTVAVDALCVGHGFTPRLELAVAAGCVLRDGFVAVDDNQLTSVPGVYAAGEVTGIAGAAPSRDEGTVAGRSAAGGNPAARQRRRRDRGRAFAVRLARAHPIGSGWPSWLLPETPICRCEGTDYGTLCRALADQAAAGARAVRLGTRAGLGPCQGRICGPTVAELTARAGGEESTVHNRPVAQPIRLGELAGTPERRSRS